MKIIQAQEQALVQQGDNIITAASGSVPVIPWGGLTTAGAAAMVVNFLRTGAPSVQCIGDKGANPEQAEELISTVEALALQGEHFSADPDTIDSQELVVFTREVS